MANPETERILAIERREAHWRRWGPYLSGRQWGTVREDYSADGNAWDSFPFEMSHLRAYRWGEDGILGISDNHQRLCFAPAFWNGRDRDPERAPLRAQRPRRQPRRGRKEVWFHLDNLPSHAYMKALYKYPQRPFPYEDLRTENARRGRESPEYELVDTGIFNDNQYFDIVIEYAKASPEDILIRINVTNRSAARAPLHVLPTMWYRNEWSWKAGVTKPVIGDAGETNVAMVTQHPTLGRRWLIGDGNAVSILYTENETNYERAFGVKSPRPYAKDAFGRFLINNDATAVNPKRTGTKATFQYTSVLEPGATETIRLRLSDAPGTLSIDPVAFDRIVDQRIAEADEFYDSLLPATADRQARTIQRRALAGLLWTKQCYNYIIRDWLKGDPLMPPPPPERLHGRNLGLDAPLQRRGLSMPDKWEYPWYASWDLAFHVHRVLADRSRFRQTPAGRADARTLHAPQRPAAGVRVGVRRRQPAGARLGRVPHLQDRGEAPRRRWATCSSSSAYSRSCC